jgi:TRAP-type C4-dicarboxylate transport system permease small subunit
MIRGLIVWSIITLVIFGFRYFIDKGDQTTIKEILKKLSYCSLLSFFVVVLLYVLNNVQGV